MKHAIRRAVFGIFTAILASFLLVNPATADHHVRAFSAPFIPGAARGAYSNAFIMVTNQQSVSAPLHLKAYVNGDSMAQECATQPDLRPYEIRRFARSGGTLCVARDEQNDYSIRIRTIDGVQVSGYLVLAADRNRMLIPMEIGSVQPEGPEGISIGSVAVLGTNTRFSRVRVTLHSTSGLWPYPMQLCVQRKVRNPNYVGIINDASYNCALPNEVVRGWIYGNIYYNTALFVRQNDSNTSLIANVDTDIRTALNEVEPIDGGRQHLSSPILLRVCINPLEEDGTVLHPINCRIITADGVEVRNMTTGN